MQDKNRRLLTLRETAQILGVSVDTARRWADEGELPCTTIGTRRYFPRAAVEAWLAEQTRRALERVVSRR